jgi:SAM-dependent methyltransferase
MERDEFLNPKPFSGLDVVALRRGILAALERTLPSFQGTLLDVGCGKMPYKKMLLSHPSGVTRHIGLDLATGRYALFGPFDLEWDGEHIPLSDNSVDCAIATEVLEQCPHPDIILREVHRVLKPAGTFFFTVPFLWPVHDPPYDQYRFTPFALDRELHAQGFVDIRLDPLGGWDASLSQMIALWVRRRPMNRWIRMLLTALTMPLVLLLLGIDRVPRRSIEYEKTVMITGIAGTCKKGKG